MSRRNTRDAKRTRAVRRLLSVPLPAQIDLVRMLQRDYRVTAGKARAALAAGALKVDSHPLTNEYAPASVRGRIVIVKPELLA